MQVALQDYLQGLLVIPVVIRMLSVKHFFS